MTALNIVYTENASAAPLAEYSYDDSQEAGSRTGGSDEVSVSQASDRGDLFQMARKIAYRGVNRRATRGAVSIF